MEQYNDSWVGIEEIANYLGVKVVTVRKWIKAEKIPCHKIG